MFRGINDLDADSIYNGSLTHAVANSYLTCYLGHQELSANKLWVTKQSISWKWNTGTKGLFQMKNVGKENFDLRTLNSLQILGNKPERSSISVGHKIEVWEK